MSAEAAKSTELPAPTREEVEKMIETFRTEGDPSATELYEIESIRLTAEGKIQERAEKIKKLLERMAGAKPVEPTNVLTLVQPTPTPAPAEEPKPTEAKKGEPAKPALKSHEKHANAEAIAKAIEKKLKIILPVFVFANWQNVSAFRYWLLSQITAVVNLRKWPPAMENQNYLAELNIYKGKLQPFKDATDDMLVKIYDFEDPREARVGKQIMDQVKEKLQASEFAWIFKVPTMKTPEEIAKEAEKAAEAKRLEEEKLALAKKKAEERQPMIDEIKRRLTEAGIAKDTIEKRIDRLMNKVAGETPIDKLTTAAMNKLDNGEMAEAELYGKAAGFTFDEIKALAEERTKKRAEEAEKAKNASFANSPEGVQQKKLSAKEAARLAAEARQKKNKKNSEKNDKNKKK